MVKYVNIVLDKFKFEFVWILIYILLNCCNLSNKVLRNF